MTTDGKPAAEAAIKLIKLRYAGVCTCGAAVAPGSYAGWDKVTRSVLCETCVATPPADSNGAAEQPVDIGRPGASLDREYQRRKHSHENRVRARFPRLGGLLLAVTGEPASTKSFAIGAEGEQHVASRLEKACGDEVLFLHNRRLGKRRRDGDIDHLAIAASGIYVIDAKHYKDATVRVRRTGGLLSPAREQLLINGRDRTNLIAGSTKQRDALLVALDNHPLAASVSVTSLLCFRTADLPFWGDAEIAGVRVLALRGTIKLLRRNGPLTPSDRQSLHRHLAAELPPA
ncbi:nuclease-like protein [Kribbella voronezhensis]|uniref:Nuclease-like protein n=1 Tax=Kribbella voronezhensis TaxID=2512212 RepID=A0A4R7TIE0_9ACTN|nr:nuclease-related domain-containing protein [Kribbella voronezhensis]TDU91257.1 nuclease-like protein [Kribbella voronezhensis]